MGAVAIAIRLEAIASNRRLSAFIDPRAPNTFSEGVWGGFRGSKYLLRRSSEP